MLLRKLQTLAGTFLAFAVFCGGAGVLWHYVAAVPAAVADPSGAALAGDPAREEPDETLGAPPRALAPPAGPVAHPVQSKIGLLNMTRTIKGSKKFQALQYRLRDRMRQTEQKLADMKKTQQQFQAVADDPTAPADRREDAALRVRDMKRQIEGEKESAKATVDRESGAACVVMYREVEEAARRVANVKGLELVLFYNDAVTDADFYKPANLQRKLSQPNGLMPLVVSPGMDITDAVIDALNLLLWTPVPSKP